MLFLSTKCAVFCVRSTKFVVFCVQSSKFMTFRCPTKEIRDFSESNQQKSGFFRVWSTAFAVFPALIDKTCIFSTPDQWNSWFLTDSDEICKSPIWQIYEVPEFFFPFDRLMKLRIVPQSVIEIFNFTAPYWHNSRFFPFPWKSQSQPTKFVSFLNSIDKTCDFCVPDKRNSHYLRAINK